MATSPTPTVYRPNLGSALKRFMLINDPNTYPNQGSSRFEVTPSEDPNRNN